MDPIILTFIGIAAVYFVLNERHRSKLGMRKLSYAVHIQARTEEAEHMDFAVQLFEDETIEVWEEKLKVACDLTEKRRKFNNERIFGPMQDDKAKLKEQLKEAQKSKVLQAVPSPA